MKFAKAFIFIALICSTSAWFRPPSIIQRIRDLIANGQDLINQLVINQIEAQRENFSTGWPALGIPPIDPFYIEELNATIDTIGTLSSIDFSLRDAHLVGLQQFKIEDFNLRILGLSLQFDISFNRLVVDGQHVTRASLGILPINGAGSIVMVLNDVKISGTVQMNTLQGRYLNLDKLSLAIAVGSVDATLRGFGFLLDPTISLALSVGLPIMINDSQERINELVAEQLVEPVNEILNQYRMIDVIIAIVRLIAAPTKLPNSIVQALYKNEAAFAVEN